jgi:hypothetical protein
VDGLGQNRVPVATYKVGSTGDQEYFAVGAILRNIIGEIDAAHSGHHHIRDERVRR